MSDEIGEPFSIDDLIGSASTYLKLHPPTKTLKEIVRDSIIETNRQEQSRLTRSFDSVLDRAMNRKLFLHALESNTTHVTEEFLVAASGSHLPVNPVATLSLILRIAKDIRNNVSPELLVLRYGSHTLATLSSVVANSFGDPGLAGYFFSIVGQRSLDEVVARVTISRFTPRHLRFLKDLESQISQNLAPLRHA